MPCHFEGVRLAPTPPDTATCSAAMAANGVTIQFSYDATTQTPWFSYVSEHEPLSGIVYAESLGALVPFVDGPASGAFPLPWGADASVGMSLYQDHLFYGEHELGPEDGAQSFTMADGGIYAVSRWTVGNETVFAGRHEDGVLLPTGTDSWIDETGTTPAIHSFRKFIEGTEFPTLSPQRCLPSSTP